MIGADGEVVLENAKIAEIPVAALIMGVRTPSLGLSFPTPRHSSLSLAWDGSIFSPHD